MAETISVRLARRRYRRNGSQSGDRKRKSLDLDQIPSRSGAPVIRKARASLAMSRRGSAGPS
jgi:hypothetical protein